MSSASMPSSPSDGKPNRNDDGLPGLQGRLTDQNVTTSVMDNDTDETPAITKIEFESVDPKAKKGEYNSAEDPSPYVSLAHPKFDELQQPDEVVSTKPMRIHFSYPMANKHTVTLNKSNITRMELAKFVTDHYQAIYAEEAGTSPNAPGIMSEVGYNRNRTAGTYGIWGHDIGDLLLYSVGWDAEEKRWRLGIDS